MQMQISSLLSPKLSLSFSPRTRYVNLCHVIDSFSSGRLALTIIEANTRLAGLIMAFLELETAYLSCVQIPSSRFVCPQQQRVSLSLFLSSSHIKLWLIGF
jgi:hypothetical protein